MKMILRGTILHAPRRGTLETGTYLILKDGVIQAVTDRLPPDCRDLPVEDFGEKLILQSFADVHLHAPQYPMLGMGMDLPLLDWLSTYTFRTEAAFADTDYARRCYRALARALIDGGTPRVAMFSSLHTDATLILMEELEAAGVTGYVGKVNMDRNGGENYVETTEESWRETLRWLEGCTFPHVRPILTPRFTPTCSDELMERLGRLGLERKLPVQSHLSENTGEVAWVRALRPDCAQYWETYHKHHMFRPGAIMAHCVYSDEREQQALADNGVLMAHCPASNWNLCSGTAPVREMLDRGIWVALGSDIAGGDQLFMARSVTMAIRASKLRSMSGGGPFLTAAEGYWLATTSGHRFFGGGDGFAPGDKLHAMVVDESAFPPPCRPLTSAERLERALYLMEPSAITAVYSEGRRVK